MKKVLLLTNMKFAKISLILIMLLSMTCLYSQIDSVLTKDQQIENYQGGIAQEEDDVTFEPVEIIFFDVKEDSLVRKTILDSYNKRVKKDPYKRNVNQKATFKEYIVAIIGIIILFMVG